MVPQKKIAFQECTMCHSTIGVNNFTKTKNIFYPAGVIPVCNECLVKMIDIEDWNSVDKICQMIDIPFIPERWAELQREQGANAIIPYSKIFQSTEYERIGWGEYQKQYKQLEKEGRLATTIIPQLEEEERIRLKQKWGANYDDEELSYLERLFNGIKNSQSVNGDLQTDQALKICKISLCIDSSIREGKEIDKLLGSYEKLVKIAEFTPKNIKNAQDFDSVGELVAYLEKTGFENKFYDGAQRDIIDVTMNNIQNFCQRLYTNEPGIGEDIDRRIQSLQKSKEIEDNMGLFKDYTLESMNSEVNKIVDEEQVPEEFDPGVI